MKNKWVIFFSVLYKLSHKFIIFSDENFVTLKKNKGKIVHYLIPNERGKDTSLTSRNNKILKIG